MLRDAYAMKGVGHENVSCVVMTCLDRPPLLVYTDVTGAASNLKTFLHHCSTSDVRPSSISWHSTTPTPTSSPTSSRGSSRERRRVVQLDTGITSGNRACQTCRRGSLRGCSCRCRCRGMPAITVIALTRQRRTRFCSLLNATLCYVSPMHRIGYYRLTFICLRSSSSWMVSST